MHCVCVPRCPSPHSRNQIAVSRNSARQFWEEIRRDGAPLIEPVPGESNYSRVNQP
jgi:hypothetical protein